MGRIPDILRVAYWRFLPLSIAKAWTAEEQSHGRLLTAKPCQAQGSLFVGAKAGIRFEADAGFTTWFIEYKPIRFIKGRGPMGLLNGLYSLALKLGGSSLELARVKSRFQFLEQQGFCRYLIKTPIIFILEYKRENLLISPGYDCREQVFSVALGDLSKQESNSVRIDILATEIGPPEARRHLKQEVDSILQDIRASRHGMSPKHFDSIVCLYTAFLQEYMDDILEWKYSV